MTRVTLDSEPPFDFWPYFDGIAPEDFDEHDCSDESVDYAYTTSCGKYQHVLVNSEHENVFMVLVLDLSRKRVVGHRLLNLGDEYGTAKDGPGAESSK